MEKILITGGLGHLGSALIAQLHNLLKNRKENQVTVVDNMATQRYCSLFHFPPEFKFIEADFKDIDPTDYTTIVHLAAVTNAPLSIVDPEANRYVNVEDTKTFLGRCLDKRIIFPSTTSVYGSAIPTMLEDSPLNPQSPYAANKIEVENYLLESAPKALIPRFGTIAGASMGMRFHTAINKFCFQARFNQPLTVWKDNYEMERPYLSIADATNFICWGIFIKPEEVGIFNVVTKNIKLEHITNYLKNKTDVTINFVDTPLLNQYSYTVDNSKSKKAGFKYVGNIFGEIDSVWRTL